MSKKASIAHVPSGMLGKLATLVTAFATNPAAMELWRELEECRVQAEAAGVQDWFEDLWGYELERTKEVPGAALMPKQVLSLALKTAPV